ncbi:MAG: hypothetical protein JWM47_1054 [Acidimicrobiales bacterium]|nr:hypothetical protein [Acidimicrobiales bacterium]
MSIRRTLQLALALVAASVVFAFGSAAGAVENPDYGRPPEKVKTTVPQPVRRTNIVVAPPRTALAITGSDATQLVVVGGLLLAGGTATLLLRRRVVA